MESTLPTEEDLVATSIVAHTSTLRFGNALKSMAFIALNERSEVTDWDTGKPITHLNTDNLRQALKFAGFREHCLGRDENDKLEFFYSFGEEK